MKEGCKISRSQDSNNPYPFISLLSITLWILLKFMLLYFLDQKCITARWPSWYIFFFIYIALSKIFNWQKKINLQNRYVDSSHIKNLSIYKYDWLNIFSILWQCFSQKLFFAGWLTKCIYLFYSHYTNMEGFFFNCQAVYPVKKAWREHCMPFVYFSE